MSNLREPPITDDMIDSIGNPKASLSWILFFNNIFLGDRGTKWNPAFTSLTTVGAPTITGRYYQISKSLCYFSVNIIPATSTTSTAGTTYINNFPLKITQDGAVNAVSGLLGATPGQAEAATNRIYVPAWAAVTVPLTVCGTIEAK